MRIALLAALTLLLISTAEASTIVVTVADFKPIVEAVAGEEFEVYSLLPPGSDPHVFSLTVEDVERLKSAELIVLANSELLDFEKKIAREFPNTLDFEDYNAKLYDFPGFEKNLHGYWMLPENAIGIAKAVKNRLSEMYPAKEEQFEENYKAFVERVEEAEKEAKKIAEGEAEKKYVAMVPGVCYIAKTYDLSVAAVLISEGAGAASAKELTEIREKLNKGEYRGIIVPEFMKGGKGEELAEELVKGTNARIAWVKFSSGDVAYDTMLISNAARIAYATSHSECSSDSMWIYVLSVLCIVEALIIAVIKVRT
ncbi:metal ABC transporter solute-binding protein, Zn/Mn family [Archaeoglobus sp.]